MQHPPHSETSHLLGTSLETPRRDRPRWVLAQMAWGGQEHPVLLGRPGLRGGTSPWPTWGTALALPRRSALLLWSPSVVHVYVLAARYLTEQEEREQSRNVSLAHSPPACLGGTPSTSMLEPVPQHPNIAGWSSQMQAHARGLFTNQ